MKKILCFVISFILAFSLFFGLLEATGTGFPQIKVEKALALSKPTSVAIDNPLLSGSSISANKSSYRIDKTVTIKVKVWYFGKKMFHAPCIINIWWVPSLNETKTQYFLYSDKGKLTLKIKLSDIEWSKYLTSGQSIGISANICLWEYNNSLGTVGPIIVTVK
jgi:hypothetical protein